MSRKLSKHSVVDMASRQYLTRATKEHTLRRILRIEACTILGTGCHGRWCTAGCSRAEDPGIVLATLTDDYGYLCKPPPLRQQAEYLAHDGNAMRQGWAWPLSGIMSWVKRANRVHPSYTVEPYYAWGRSRAQCSRWLDSYQGKLDRLQFSSPRSAALRRSSWYLEWLALRARLEANVGRGYPCVGSGTGVRRSGSERG